jgi:hypothetical protein
MVERVKIESNRILLLNAEGRTAFDTNRNYIKQDPSGILKVGGYDRMPSVYGYTQGNIIDHGNGGCWVWYFVEDAYTIGPNPYNLYLSNGFAPYDYIIKLGVGVNYQKYNPAVDYTQYVSWHHPVVQYEMYNKYLFGDTWVPAVDMYDNPLYYRWVVTVTAIDGVTWPEKLWPLLCKQDGWPIEAVQMKHGCSVRFKFSTMDRQTWGTQGYNAGYTYVEYYGNPPWNVQGSDAARFGLKTMGIMSLSPPITLSGTITT